MATNSNRLYRGDKDSMLFGVAAGLGEYFDIDPTLVRIAWIALAIASAGAALIAYILLAIIMPKQGSAAEQPSRVLRENLSELPEDAAEAISRNRNTERWGAPRNLFALILIGIGGVSLLANLGFFFWWSWDIMWPLVLIGIGAALLFRRFWRRDDD